MLVEKMTSNLKMSINHGRNDQALKNKEMEDKAHYYLFLDEILMQLYSMVLLFFTSLASHFFEQHHTHDCCCHRPTNNGLTQCSFLSFFLGGGSG